MVDKSQQTEVTEKKKQLSIPQSSCPKAAFSIGNIPGSKLNYEYHRASSTSANLDKEKACTGYG